MKFVNSACAFCCTFAWNAAGFAHSAGPVPLAMPPDLAAPRDVAYAGTIRLFVDATDVTRHVFRVHETIPVHGGRLTLLYPKWVPGNHAPSGRLDSLAGLIMTAGGKRVEWIRDPTDVYAFHVDLPSVATLELDFQFLSAPENGEGRVRVVTTPEMLNLQWHAVVLYPAGYFVRQILFEPSVELPEGWQFATALETASATGNRSTFKAVSLETLVDSPIFAGRYAKRVNLGTSGTTPVRLNIFADRADLLETTPEQIDVHRALVSQAQKLFGSPHYAHYDFLLALTDRLGAIALEHQQSSENATVPTYFTDWDKNPDARDLLPHEYTHSWNGKFRRPADLWTANYNVPMRNSLLWMYEGQTEYWGYVLAARAGLLSKEQALDALAWTAATCEYRLGREWKTLQDTTNDPTVAMRRTLPWRSWQRSEDYYSEGELVWLDVDTRIRELSKDRVSLDDFARAFFSMHDGSTIPVTYTFSDVVNTLNKVQPYDWGNFLRARLQGHGPGAPLDGISRGGYKLVYTVTPSDYFKKSEGRYKQLDLTYSIGMIIGKEAKVSDVLWNGPAYNAGVTVGAQIVAVNGTAFDADRLKDVIKEAVTGTDPIELLLRTEDRYSIVHLSYHGGLRYPHLERVSEARAWLDDILTSRK